MLRFCVWRVVCVWLRGGSPSVVVDQVIVVITGVIIDVITGRVVWRPW